MIDLILFFVLVVCACVAFAAVIFTVILLHTIWLIFIDKVRAVYRYASGHKDHGEKDTN